MNVKLIGITQPRIKGISSPGEFIAYVARVSNPSNQNNSLTSAKLLKYLVKHKHWSPFELVSVVLSIETTRDIARQILRHRSFSFQEFSQRYADPNVLGYSYKETRLQDITNRQNSIEVNDEKLNAQWQHNQQVVANLTAQTYKWAIDNNIAKEIARSVLPEGLILSRLYMAGSLRSWIHYIDIRCSKETQKEHREIALACKDIIIKEFPELKDILTE